MSPSPVLPSSGPPEFDPAALSRAMAETIRQLSVMAETIRYGLTVGAMANLHRIHGDDAAERICAELVKLPGRQQAEVVAFCRALPGLLHLDG